MCCLWILEVLWQVNNSFLSTYNFNFKNLEFHFQAEMFPYPMKLFGLTTYESREDNPSGSSITFSPVLSEQRYKTIVKVIRDYAELELVKTVTDFGCANFSFFCQHLLVCEFLSTVNLVDIDRKIIETALPIISLERYRQTVSNGRNTLTVNIFEGSVAKKDDRILGSDVVVAIELIEHLFPDELEQFPSTVFGFIQPKLVIITTPNYDFNVLFENGNGFRHYDHKFEFTKTEFADWTNNIIQKYDYSVKLYGIGEPPINSENVGYCSQMAVFKKLSNDTTTILQKFTNYNLIGSYQYFYITDSRTDEEKILEEIHRVSARYKDDDNYQLDFENESCPFSHRSIALPLHLFTQHCKKWLPSEEKLIQFLENYRMQYPVRQMQKLGYVIILQDDCDIYDCKSSL